jgi:hypothetical protein
MDDDKNKASGILGLGDTPVSNRDRDLDDRIADDDVTRDRIRDDEATRDRARVRDNEETAREGSAAQGTGILGLGGAAVPKSPLDPSASDDLDSAHRRRERMLDTEGTTGERGADRHAGAAGIDMGAGGEGTDVSGR